MSERLTAIETFDRIRADPAGFCRDVLRFEPWSKQRDVLTSVRDNSRTAVRSCHGAGKTAIAARAACWFLAAFPRSRVITTAPTWAQVKDLLWREIRGTFHASAGFFDGELFDTRLELGDDWFALGLSTDKPERFQGHHAEHLLLVIDEASGVGQDIFEAGAGFITSPGARMLLIGNPTRTSGEFFDAFHRSRAFYSTIAISALDTPAFTGEKVSDEALRRLVSREWVEEHAAKWGEGSPLYHVRVLGEFPSQSDDAVCSLADVEGAQARELEPGFPLVVSCDVARFGTDETVIALRRGGHVRIARSYSGRDTMRTAGEILAVARQATAGSTARATIVVDDAGLGGGVTDRLREQAEFSVLAFNGAERARVASDYPNRRSETWFAFAEQLADIDLDEDEQLAADLTSPRYTIDSAGRRVVESKSETKKRLGRSPDRADAVLMAFSVGASALEAAFHRDDARSSRGESRRVRASRQREYEEVQRILSDISQHGHL